MINAMAGILRRGGPTPSVAEFARLCACDASTLRRWWAESSFRDTPAAFLEWHCLLEAAMLRDTGASALRIAYHLRVSTSKLFRLCRRRLDCAFSRVSTDLVVGRLTEWLGVG